MTSRDLTSRQIFAALLVCGAVWFPALRVDAQVVVEDWKSASDLDSWRFNHSATLLSRGPHAGRVLVVGGSGETGLLASSEMFDTATGSWFPTSDLLAARSHHTATLLPSGDVLVVGGSVTQAELWNAESATWSDVGATESRYGHSATLLSNGDVLVAGGPGPPTTEIFTSGGTWAAGPPMNAARAYHAAALLQDGRVLVTGGGTSACEIFDPGGPGVPPTWSPTAPMAVSRSVHSATVIPDGRVVVCGGCTTCDTCEIYGPTPADPMVYEWTDLVADPRLEITDHSMVLLPDGRLLGIGGRDRATPTPNALTAAFYLDPIAGTVEDAPDLTYPQYRATATVLPSGGVLSAGGKTQKRTDVFTTVQDSWSVPASAPAGPFRGHAQTLLPDGTILIAGSGTAAVDDEALVVDPLTATSVAVDPMPQAMTASSATLLVDGRVLVTGEGTSTAFLFDPDATAMDPVWTAATGMTARSSHSALLIPSSEVAVLGGGVVDVDVYDPATGWRSGGDLLRAHAGATATLLDSGEILVRSERNGELYDPKTRTSRATSFGSEPRVHHSATLLRSGRILVAGGRADPTSIIALHTTEIYDPRTDAWTRSGDLQLNKIWPSSSLLGDGRVLICGGWTNFGGVLGVRDECELFDPTTATTRLVQRLPQAMEASSSLLPDGRVFVTAQESAGMAFVLYEPNTWPASRRSIPSTVPADWSVGQLPLTIEVDRRFSATEASDGTSRNSSAAVSFLTLQSMSGERIVSLPTRAETTAWVEASTATLDALPETLDAGWYQLRNLAGGIPGDGTIVNVPCSASLSEDPLDATAAIGEEATFSASAIGSRVGIHWEQCVGDAVICAPGGPGWEPIAGAVGPTYTTPPIVGPEAGTRYRAVATAACGTQAPSAAALLQVEDSTPPNVEVVAPTGGEYWILSEPGQTPRTELVTWAAEDDVRICRLRATLHFSDDGGATWAEVPSGSVLFEEDLGTSCIFPGVEESSALYTVPTSPPSGSTGSLYKVFLEARDHADNDLPLEPTCLTLDTIGDPIPSTCSTNPFYIVSPNPDSVRTLIFHDIDRMQALDGFSATVAADLRFKLAELASHPRVQGFVVDLGGITELQALVADWDALDATTAPDFANHVLFGCEKDGGVLPTGCSAERPGLHESLRALLDIFTGVEHLVVVGDDRIVPMARIPDRTVLLTEPEYVGGGDLVAGDSPAAAALNGDLYLSDDPFATRDPIAVGDLASALFVPDLAVGRLVETSGEIITTIATFISQDGVLDLTTYELPTGTGHQVLVSGYDFLTDTATKIRARWEAALCEPGGCDHAYSPVNGVLVGDETDWGGGTVADRVGLLYDHLDGDPDPVIDPGGAGRAYALGSLNGHANHYGEGVPGEGAFDIQGLDALEIAGGDDCGNVGTSPGLDLAGTVLYSVGCHGGLVVPGSCSDQPAPTFDLTQAVMRRGAVAYVANSGYGWGLLSGIGYGERLVEIFTEEMTAGTTLAVGDGVVTSKRRYVLENPSIDAYDEKSLQQWTLYGLPMYAVRTGIGSRAATEDRPFEGPAPTIQDLENDPIEEYGPVRVERVAVDSADDPIRAPVLPPYLTRVELLFDFGAPGVYTKHTASGNVVAPTTPCPDAEGCYYTLNGLVERGTGSTDLPIQPYFTYDSRLSGTSQHGVLWMGGTYEEETDWIPVKATLVSNSAAGVGDDHGAAPRSLRISPGPTRVVTGEDPSCRSADLELNGLVVPTGETASVDGTDDRERIFTEVRMEALYFNNGASGFGNCDRDGPVLGTRPFGPAEPGCSDPDGCYHRALGIDVEWAIPTQDADSDGDIAPDAEVWRVVVAYTDGALADTNADGRLEGTWQPLDLVEDAGVWRGGITLSSEASTLSYIVQAVDTRGNVTWRQFVPPPDQLPNSGVVPELVLPEEIAIQRADLAVALTDLRTESVPGESVTYTLEVTNEGPSPVAGARVQDSQPTALQGTSWSCTAAPGASCQAGMHTGPINDLVDLPVGATVTYTVEAQVDPAARGPLTYAAWATTPLGASDLVTENDEASDVNALVPRADLRITKDDGQEDVPPGATLSYTIDVTNDGPSAVFGATVSDVLPALLLDGSWTCQALGSAVCTAGPTSGDLTDSVDLPVGAMARYTVTATLDPSAAGSVENTASIGGGDAAETNGSDNAATDVDTVGSRPPRVAEVYSVSRPEGHFTAAAITQLQVRFDEPVVGASQASSFELLGAGPDGLVQTSACGTPAGDDIPVQVDWAFYDAGLRTASLGVDAGDVLRPGHYGLLACASSLADQGAAALDGNGDGTAGDDHLFRFRITAKHLTENPTFDTELGSWATTSALPPEISHDPAADSDGAATSGAVRIVNGSGPSATFGLEQCTASSRESWLEVAGRIRHESDGSSRPRVNASLESFDGPACAGAPTTTIEQTVEAPSGGWSRFSFLAPVQGRLSHRVRFTISAEGASAFTLWFDDLFVRTGPIFVDGFEGGDTSAWSADLP